MYSTVSIHAKNETDTWACAAAWGGIGINNMEKKIYLFYPEIFGPDPSLYGSACQWAAQLVSSLITLY